MNPRRYVYLLTTVVLLLIGLLASHALSLGSTANASATPPTGWTVESVDVGEDVSLGLDADGLPHISYHGGDDDLRYAYRGAHGWELVTVDSAGSVGRATSLALDMDNQPHISYQKTLRITTAGRIDVLRRTFRDDTGWHTETIGGEDYQVMQTSLRTDGLGAVGIAFHADSLKYASLGSTGWQVEVVDTSGHGGSDRNLVFDHQGRPRVIYSYASADATGLRYAYADGAGWHIEDVDNECLVGYDSAALRLDAQGQPHASYLSDCGSGGVSLKYAHRGAGGNWQSEVVDTGLELWWQMPTSVGVDAQGGVHISYFDLQRSVLKYAVRNPGETAWRVVSVDALEPGRRCNSLALDKTGHPHIAYCSGERQLKFATYSPPVSRVYLPLVLSRYKAVGLRRVFQLDQPATALASQGDSLYLGVGGRLLVLDVSDPLRPMERGRSQVLSRAVSDIVVAGSYAYVAAGTDVHILDIATAPPVEVASVATPDSALAVAVAGEYLFVAAASAGLRIVDIENPLEPSEIGVFHVADEAVGIAVNDTVAYVIASTHEPHHIPRQVQVVDVSSPSSPLAVSAFSYSCNAVNLSGTYAYVATGDLELSDIIIGPPPPPPLPASCLQLVDISEPAHPVGVYEYECSGSGQDVVVAESRVYLAVRTGGPEELHILNAVGLRLLTSYAIPNPGGLLAQSAHRIYIAAGGHLYVLDE